MDRMVFTTFEKDAILLTLSAGNKVKEGDLIRSLSSRHRIPADKVADQLAIMIQRKGLLLACIDGKTNHVTLSVPSHKTRQPNNVA